MFGYEPPIARAQIGARNGSKIFGVCYGCAKVERGQFAALLDQWVAWGRRIRRRCPQGLYLSVLIECDTLIVTIDRETARAIAFSHRPSHAVYTWRRHPVAYETAGTAAGRGGVPRRSLARLGRLDHPPEFRSPDSLMRCSLTSLNLCSSRTSITAPLASWTNTIVWMLPC